MKIEKPEIIEGGFFEDLRGRIQYVNDFHFENVRRFYLITHPEKSIIRAWQGHQQETKSFYVTKGSFVVAWVKIDHFENPSQDLKAEHIILKAGESKILTLPPGYANGLNSLEPNSQIMVFSDYLLNESLDNKYRFDKDLWFNWNLFIRSIEPD